MLQIVPTNYFIHPEWAKESTSTSTFLCFQAATRKAPAHCRTGVTPFWRSPGLSQKQVSKFILSLLAWPLLSSEGNSKGAKDSSGLLGYEVVSLLAPSL